MTLEGTILEILAKKEANAQEIAEELEVDIEEVNDVLRRLESAGLLITE